MNSITIKCFVFTILLPVIVVQAYFFTNSHETDYPRIGKRVLPAHVYKAWYEHNRNLPTNLRSYDRISRLSRESINPETPSSLSGYYATLRDNMEQEKRQRSNLDLNNLIMSYVHPEDYDY